MRLFIDSRVIPS